jgi:adenosylhomocysteine nucleosidase
VVVAVLAAMPSELRPFVRASGLRRSGSGDGYTGEVAGREVVATTMGVGMAGAALTAERTLQSGNIDRLIVTGIAGGIDPSLPIGHVVVPQVVVDGQTGTAYDVPPWDPVEPQGRLVTYGDFQAELEAMAELQRQGFAAIDMETAAVAAVCKLHGCPYAVFRAISDNATNGSVDAAIAAMARPDGAPDRKAVLRYVIRRPWRIPRLLRLGRDARRAAAAAATAAVTALRA